MADKNASQTQSGRSIDTRELSDNLKTVRDGLNQYMRDKNRSGNIQMHQGSDSESDDERSKMRNNMAIGATQQSERQINSQKSDKRDVNSQNSAVKGKLQGSEGGNMSSFNDISNNNQDMIEGTTSGNRNFPHGFNSSRDLESNMLSSRDAKRITDGGKVYLDGEMVSNDDYNNYNGKNGKNRDNAMTMMDAKQLVSQDPKKDGPLFGRIFVDAFFPSLEGNRIYPLFNYRCAEKLERESKDFYENNRLLHQKQLLPVIRDGEGELKDQRRVGLQEMPKENSNLVGSHSRQTATEPKKEAAKIEEVRKVEVKKEEIKKENIKKEEVKKKDVKKEEVKKEEVKKDEAKKEVVKKADGKDAKIIQKGDELQQVQEKEELVRAQKQEVAVNELNEVDTTVKTAVDQVESKSIVTKTNVVEESPVSNVTNETNKKETVSSNNTEKPSEDDEKYMRKIFRLLLADEELMDVFCERVIAKIAARNDFCGPNCGSTCGGLNKPNNLLVGNDP